jgi:hypothetical protein
MLPGTIPSLGLSAGGAVAAPYNIARSLQFRNGSYLSRTWAAQSDRTKFTVSVNFKRLAFRSQLGIFSGYYDDNNRSYIDITNDQFRVVNIVGGAVISNVSSTHSVRDTSAHGHLVVAVDTNQAVNTDRVKVYWNGVQLAMSGTFPGVNESFLINFSNHQIGVAWYSTPGGYFEGLMSDFFFIDQQQVPASAFGQIDPVTGVWMPKKYTGTYGLQGFWLDFSDNSSLAALGTDRSGLGHNWTVNNFSLAADFSYDSSLDTPTNYIDVGGGVHGNYCTWSPMNKNPNVVLYQAALAAYPGVVSPTHLMAVASMGLTTKSYFEITPLGSTGGQICMIGACEVPSTTNDGIYLGQLDMSFGYGYSPGAGNIYVGTGVSNPSGTAGGGLQSAPYGFAIDPVAGKAWIRNTDGNYWGGDPVAGTSPTLTWVPDGQPWFPAASWYNTDGNSSMVLNAGQRPYAMTPPAGYKAICTANMAVPLIGRPKNYFESKLRNGTGANAVVGGVGFQPDLIWTKSRNNAAPHVLTDSIRGQDRQLFSSTTNPEQIDADGGIVSFNADGYTVGDSSLAVGSVNQSGWTYVDWLWRRGTIQGVDVVSFTPPASGNLNVPHALGVMPAMYIVKNRGAAAGATWCIWYKLSGSAINNFLQFNGNQNTAGGGSFWGSGPTAATLGFQVGSSVNAGIPTIAYAFADVPGFAKFGAYTANGSFDGPFQFCGFTPRFLMVKCMNADGTSWAMFDSERGPINPNNKALYADLSQVEAANSIDFVSSGFKVRGGDGTINAAGYSYFYAAFAETPFKYARAK